MKRVPEPEIMDVPDRARAYADADFSGVNAAFVGRLAELCAGVRVTRVLDLGTGPGDIAFLAGDALQSRGQSPLIVGADGSIPMLRIAQDRRQAQTRAAFSCLDARRLPFPDRVFDMVYSNSILHHVANPVALWREAARVLKPGGLLFFRDLYRPKTAQAARYIVEQYAKNEHALLKDDFYNSLLAAYREDEIRAQLAAAGLGSLSISYVTDRHVDVWGVVA
ncbi:MAG: class I SAM-dependent methyltransferase [Candidatus Hydrogenedentota bacterium]